MKFKKKVGGFTFQRRNLNNIDNNNREGGGKSKRSDSDNVSIAKNEKKVKKFSRHLFGTKSMKCSRLEI